ncbi:MAG TPA: sigma-70 family RNA polymerase sigma factor [Pyrinomonadaceae bacterium]|jgi:RNA polymerase sigma-70 factor (ECF subfamily)|nr:sigma-70 family RNA polymerase sigma factor [Pyrinomonadaceae bacterium]
MDDQAAIERCRAGDSDAFRHVVEHYQAEALGHATAILGNHEDALDAVQEAFIDAFQALDRFDPTLRFYPWFYVILRNRCYKLAHGRKKRETDSSAEMEILAPTAAVNPEDSMLLEQALLELATEDRELITLRHLDGLSYQELAARLETPQGTIMSRLYHARKKLRDRLVRHSFKRLKVEL